MSPRNFLLLISLLPACRAEFDVSRDTLGPFRIAALGVEDLGEACPVATAAIWSGEGAFHSQAPQLQWTLNGEVLGEGWDVPVCEAGLLHLVARDSSGREREAQVDVQLRPETLGLRREAVVLTDLSLEARRSVQGSEVTTTVPSGQGLRVQLEGLSTNDSSAWMSPENQAHVLELDNDAADFLLESWQVDEDGNLGQRDTLEGLSSHLLLVFDGQGGNAFQWVDGAFGLSGQEFLRHEGRLIDAPGLSGIELLTATVAVDETGWHLENLAAADEESEMTAVCAKDRAHFSLDWIANGRCSLDGLAGSQILLEIW